MEYSKVYMVVNPFSGLGSSLKLFESIKNQLDSKKFDIKTLITTKRNDFVRVINENNWHDTLLMVFGGDGSFNQVMTEIIKNDISVQLLPIPCGTSNVYNKTVLVNKETIAEKINTYKLQSKQYRVGEVEYEKGRLAYFFSMCGVGFDAYIVHKLNQMRKKKLYIWSYLTVSVEELLLKGYKPVNFRVFMDTKVFENVFFSLFFNINAYGGPFAFFEKVGTYSDDFLYMIKFAQMGMSSLPYIYAKALKNYVSLLLNLPAFPRCHSEQSEESNRGFHYTEFMEAMIDQVGKSDCRNLQDKIYVHIDGDPLTTLPVVVRKSLKSITVYS